MYRAKVVLCLCSPFRGESASFLPAVLLEFPISIVQGADMAGFQPSRYAVEMEGVLGGETLVFGNLKCR